MELLYWRSLANTLANRKDRQSGKYGKVWVQLQEEMSERHMEFNSNSYDLAQNVTTLANSSVPPDEELEIWHRAWAHVTSPAQVKSFVDAKGYLPVPQHFDIHSPDTATGKPRWLRFDATQEFLDSQTMPIHNFHDEDIDAVRITRTGGLWPRIPGSRYSAHGLMGCPPLRT